MNLFSVPIFLYTLFYTPCPLGAFQWTNLLPDGTEMQVCEGHSAIFSWGVRLAAGERVESYDYIYQWDEDEEGKPVLSTDPRLTFTPDHQLIINTTKVSDTGKYILKVKVVSAEVGEAQQYVTCASLVVKAAPVIDKEGLEARLHPEIGMIVDGPQPTWHAKLSCGKFLSLGEPAVTVVWRTPTGERLPSSSYENGVFSLLVPSTMVSGLYSCEVDRRSVALSCCSNGSVCRARGSVLVDKLQAHVLFLERLNVDKEKEKVELKKRVEQLTTEVGALKARLGGMTSEALLVDSCKAEQVLNPESGATRLAIRSKLVGVYCDQETDGGGWTVIQRRQNGQVDFFRPWKEYVTGFGDTSDEFWLGLEHIHHMTTCRHYSLRVDMWDFNGTTAYAAYSRFSIESAADKYRLHVSGHNGSAEDALLVFHNNQQFSTRDKDNDVDDRACAYVHRGAWWYRNCGMSNLNGVYKANGTEGKDGVVWWNWRRWRSLKKVEMKIRPVTV